MDISALVNHDGDPAVLPRRSLSNAHSLFVSSPTTAPANLPTPSKSTRRQMPLKRKRHDPKPIWAYREGEELSPELKRVQEQRQSRPPPPTVPPQPIPQSQPPPPPLAHRNGGPPNGNGVPRPAITTRELSGFERPVSNDAHVYDEVSRKVCAFIWNQAADQRSLVRKAIAVSELTNLEIEARWGQIIERPINTRLRGYHDTETIIKSQAGRDLAFESTMTLQQHKAMNNYLNRQVQQSKLPGAARPPINYQHTKEVDTVYEMGQEQRATLPEAVKTLINDVGGGRPQRIRVTRDQATKQVIRSMIKLKLANLEISSPQTMWDYRIGINLEISYPGPVDNLKPFVEPGKTEESMKRYKDRMSYAWLGAYQVDLTQVLHGSAKIHELELELTSDVLLSNADQNARGQPNEFENLIAGMMNNLRVLSREITLPVPGK
jgi:polynucleotide 5'-triphosphatase